jgi:hypothetical protein
MTECPCCGEEVPAAAQVCRHCLHVLDREGWSAHDAGRLGADDRGGGGPLEDPPVGPIPLTGSGLAAGAFSNLRLVTVNLLTRRRGGKTRRGSS